MKVLLAVLFCSTLVYGYDFGDLKESEQKNFKNESGQGFNQMERIDKNVREINRMWDEIQKLKNEVNTLKSEIKQLKERK